MSRRRPGPNPPTWHTILDALAGQVNVLVESISDRIQTEIPSYRTMERAVLEADVSAELDRALRLRPGERPDDAELAEIALNGERQALRGDPMEDLLRAWRVATNTIVDAVRAIGVRKGVDPSEILDLIVSYLSWSDHAALAVANGHRRAELELARQDQERRGSIVRGILLGTLPAGEIRTHVDVYRLDPRKEYVALRARPLPGNDPRATARALGLDEVHLTGRGLLALLDTDVVGFLRTPPTGDMPGIVGVGPARTLDGLGESFRLATRALATAEAFGLTGAQRIDDLGLRPAILADQDVAASLRSKYVAPVASTTAATEILASVRTYLASGKHTETAAAALLVHANTLRYRIARFEELTGADLRDTRVAAEVWWVLEAPD